MDAEIIKALKNLQYTGPLENNDLFEKTIEEGPKNIEYTKCVHFLTNELRSLCNIDEEVNVIAAPEDSVSFLMEVSSFLKELGCPYDSLVQGHISDRLTSIEDKLLLLDYLTSELMAARMIQVTKPDNKIELKLQESRQASHLKSMLVHLSFSKPPANITVADLFKKLEPAVQGLVKRATSELLGTPACNFSLSGKQWEILQQTQIDLHSEYTIRREMLLKRLDCTIQSFQWSDKMKGKENKIDTAYFQKRKQLKVEPDVSIADFLGARDDIAIIEKTSSASVRKNTQSNVTKVLIGKVPDRGGRTNELAPPPPEMPSWQTRTDGGGRGGGGGGRGGQRGRGDFNRGGGGGQRGGFDSAGSFGNKGDFNKDQQYERRNSGQDNYRRGGGNNKSYGGNTGGNNSYQSGGNTYQSGTDSYQSGGNSYRGGNQSSGNSGNSYQSDGNSYQSGGNSGNSYQSSASSTSSYQSGGNSYTRGGNNYQKGGNSYQSSSGSTYQNPSSYQSSASTYEAPNTYQSSSYESPYKSSGSTYQSNKSYDNNKGSSYSSNQGQNFDSAGYYGGGGGNRSRDSGGSYESYQTEPKRPRTYDSPQPIKTTYADQYVTDSQNNQQYQSRGRGRSNYNRGRY